MKVGEVREKLKEYDQAALIEMFVAAYKLLPKYAKETEMDPIIQNGIPSGKERKAKQEAPVDFDALEAEILEFVEDAYQQNYFAPNRKIPKSKRPKWRFMVKDYIKKLQKIPEGDANFRRSCELLLKLYSMLCYACSFYLFSTDDPFRSVGITQPELYHLMAARTFQTGWTEANAREMIRAAAFCGLSRECLHAYLYSELMGLLKIPDTKKLIIEQAELMLKEEEEKLAELKRQKKRAYDSSHREFEHRENIGELNELIAGVYVSMRETEKAVKSFWKYTQEREGEISLYVLLRVIGRFGDAADWKLAYEDGLKRKIEPRKPLQKIYHDMCEKAAENSEEKRK